MHQSIIVYRRHCIRSGTGRADRKEKNLGNIRGEDSNGLAAPSYQHARIGRFVKTVIAPYLLILLKEAI